MVYTTNKEAIESLEASYDGPTVRQALIDLLETLSEVGGDVKNLGGHAASYYVLVSELDFAIKEISSWMKYDDEPVKNSLKVMTNKDFTKYFKSNLLDKLKSINGDTDGKYELPEKEHPEVIGNNFHDCIVILSQTINEIYDAIRNKNVTIYDSDSIMDLATRISQIKLGNLNVIPITITENNKSIPSDIVYDEGVPISGTAYNPVTVDVKLKGYDAKATSNGQVDLPTGYDGFSSVAIEVPVSGGSGGSSGGSGSGGSGSGSGDDYLPKLTTMDITSNGKYAPPNEYDGFSQVNVEVTKPALPEDGGQVTVTFKFRSYEKDVSDEVLDEQTVNVGDNVTYNGPPIEIEDESDFYYFNGWNPIPDRVANDMTVYTDIGLWTPRDTYIGASYNYTNLSWKEIIRASGTVAPGQLKLLKLKKNNDIVRMMYLGHGAWMCIDRKDYGLPADDGKPWPESNRKQWLNNDFVEEWLPDWLVERIQYRRNEQLEATSQPLDVDMFKNVKKNLQPGDLTPSSVANGVVAYGLQYRYSNDRVWLPSADEFQLFKTIEDGDFYNGLYSSNTVNYRSRYREEEHRIDDEHTVTYYLRNGFDTTNFYKLSGQTVTKIPAGYQRGLITKTGGEYGGVTYDKTVNEKLKLIDLCNIRSLYTSGQLQPNQDPSVVIRPQWISYSEPPFPSGSYDFKLYCIDSPISAHIPLRDQCITACTLNDARINDRYGEGEYDYTYIHSPLADYRGGSEYCSARIERYSLSQYGYLIKGATGTVRMFWTIEIGSGD